MIAEVLIKKQNETLATNACLYDAAGNPIAMIAGGIPVAVVSGGSAAPLYHVEYDYDAGQLLVYKGQAPRGSLTSAAVWQVIKYVRDVNGNITQELLSPANAIWDNRATTVVYA